MSPPRLFVAATLERNFEISLEASQANYLKNVLRLAHGAVVLVFNGKDGEWKTTLAYAQPKSLVLRCVEQTRPQTRPININLVFAPIKTARQDFMIQKAVELGATTITPIRTDYTQIKALNLHRLEANAREAAEQCNVDYVPAIAPYGTFGAWLSALDARDTLVFCDETATVENPLRHLAHIQKDAGFAVVIGPEGGFSDAERNALRARNTCFAISLGPRILRADTAAIAALATVNLFLMMRDET